MTSVINRAPACSNRKSGLITNDFHEGPFPPPAVKFSVENLLPGAEIEPAICNRNDYFPAHDLPLQVGVPVILTGTIVAVL